MPIQPVDIYHFAAKIYRTEGAAEVDYRSVVSRAYYAAFLYARNKAGLTSSGPDGHINVAEHYRLIKNQSKIGNKLKELKAMRQNSDYECAATVCRKDAGQGLTHSKEILTALGCDIPVSL